MIIFLSITRPCYIEFGKKTVFLACLHSSTELSIHIDSEYISVLILHSINTPFSITFFPMVLKMAPNIDDFQGIVLKLETTVL